MYSSYWKPNDGRESTILTDHEALHRDAATHKSIQSDETVLRPLDLETIMSSKAAVKYWYLHRPKTMEYVHKNATKIQSVGRAFAVRQLRKKYGAEYVAEMVRAHDEKKALDKLAELSPEERAAKELDDAAYDARVEDSRRLRREQIERERIAEEEIRQKQAHDREERFLAAQAVAEEEKRIAEERRLNEEQEERERAAERARREEEARALEEQRALEEAERIRVEEEERVRQEEEARLQSEEEARLAELEALRLAEEERQHEEEERLRKEEEEREAELEQQRLIAEAAALKAAAEAERLRLEEEAEQERLRLEEEAEQERIRQEEERRREEKRARREKEQAAAALAAQRAAEEAERARLQRLEAEKNEKYEQSLSKDVPVLVKRRGPGRVVNYDKENETYAVRLDNAMGGMTITANSGDVHLDDDRILSPRTKVDTPFGTGEIVGLDPHVGCYAVNTEINAPEGEQFLAFVQINDVQVHAEEEEERAIVENPSMPIPDEIGLVSARIVDSRIVNRTGKKFIQYKLEIRTNNYGTVYCWKRYSTFRSLCDRLVKEAGVRRKDIPELPHRHIVGNYSQKMISERAEKLNLFLTAAVRAEHLQWGIRVDDQIAVYKRRVKRQTMSGPASTRANGGGSRSIFSRRR